MQTSKVENSALSTAENLQESPVIQFGEYSFNIRAEIITVKNVPQKVTQKELCLALLLFQNLGKSLPRQQIFETVWGRDLPYKSRTLDTHIARLRRRLKLVPSHGFRLTSIYKFGYMLEAITD